MNQIEGNVKQLYKEDRYQLMFKLIENSDMACKLVNAFLNIGNPNEAKNEAIYDYVYNLQDIEYNFDKSNKVWGFCSPMQDMRHFYNYSNKDVKYEDINRLELYFSYLGNNYNLFEELPNADNKELVLMNANLRKGNGVTSNEAVDLKISLVNENINGKEDEVYLKIQSDSSSELINLPNTIVYVGKIDEVQEWFNELSHSIEKYEKLQAKLVEQSEEETGYTM
ncbi:MAG: hypothetical protein AB7S44_04115 [Spirochaetales bacterium]